MQLSELSQVGRAPELPLMLEVAGEPLILERLLRVLPGQRYVAVARWRERLVLAKLLVGSKSQRYFQRELEGAELMAGQGLVTPELLAQGFIEGQGGWLLFDYLSGAQSLWDAWRQAAREPLLSDAQQAVLAEALGAIGQMHAQGLWQSDLHLDNLLQHEGRLYLIDGGGVRYETPGQPLSRARVLENLGVFFAQLPAELDPFLEELLIHYLLANGEHALPLEMLQAEISKVRRWRLRDYLRKVARDCSLFAACIGAFGLRVVRREAEPALQPLLTDLDARIDAGHIYKTGGAATVARVELYGRPLVVKRYNVKNLLHWFKRFWRPSRAWHSWREGNRLQLLGITTPTPLAVIERRWCWLRGRAYLITDYCGGQDIIARFEAYLQATPPETELLALDRLFAAMLRERISHGDFKGHNLFWDDTQGAWSLIDLDAMRQHRSTRSFARAYARDRARFLRNWPADSALHQLLDQRLPQVPGTCPN
ncbi:lipopolysaccharide kinase InaA family protein [Ectopseudomonas mendocina]|uniref:Serine/threonine protein kinase n=1 Tax=Ectopseudomonas mendocina S5.2 TaxID=1225174 RepID=A0ABM5W136_ECTME|nr:lipopolysaccharide kinase InaA family protein [Pseudomonas mendocina]ALN20909.1 serine/threonine protein kinase [Pseudomonas mendocina S5.2]KES02790.1 serine/threonine protein kinase [Pseudomonas mendocina]